MLPINLYLLLTILTITLSNIPENGTYKQRVMKDVDQTV